MKTTEIQNTVKKEVTFSVSVEGKKIEAWRKKGGYVLRWAGFEMGKVAPRNERSSDPYFEAGITSDEIRNHFDSAIN